MTDLEQEKLHLIYALVSKEILERQIIVVEVPEFKKTILECCREAGEKERIISDATARRYMNEKNMFTKRQFKQLIKTKMEELKGLSIEEIHQKYNLSVEEEGDQKEDQKENLEKKYEEMIKPEEDKSSSSSSSNRKRKRDSEENR